MSSVENPKESFHESVPPTGAGKRRHCVLVTLTDEQLAAVEGWRTAHGMMDQPAALGELVRLGLLSEIARIYRFVSENRTPPKSRNGHGSERKSARAG